MKIPKKKTDLAWIAGLIDGEGSVHIRKHKRPNDKTYYYGEVAIGMCHEPTIRRLQQLCSGAGRIQIKRGKKRQHKTCYVWYLSITQEANFLRAILPFVFTKRKQVECLLRLSLDEAIGQKCYQQARKLNVRGQKVKA